MRPYRPEEQVVKQTVPLTQKDELLGGVDEMTTSSLSERAAYDCVFLLVQGNVKTMNYRAYIFVGLMMTAFLNALCIIVEIIYTLVLGLDFFHLYTILYLSLRGSVSLFFITLPYLVHSADMDVTLNEDDQKTLEEVRKSPEFMGSTFNYYTPGCLYDDRDARNIVSQISMMFSNFVSTILTISILSALYHQSNKSKNQLVSGDDFTPSFYARLLVAIGVLIVLHFMEFYFIVTSVHMMYKKAETPPYSFFAKKKDQ